MNQVSPNLNNGITWPGQGNISSQFSYDPLERTCVQQQVCQDGNCESTLQADSIIDYHQGNTMLTSPGFPTVFQSESTFPAQMFGDLGPPGNGQILNPTIKPVQPIPGQNDKFSAYNAPIGFKYWQDSSKNQNLATQQGVNPNTVKAQIVFNDIIWIPIPSPLPVATNIESYKGQNSTFDSTGSGYDPSKYTVSTGNAQNDIYESSYAPTVIGPVMSGPMASCPNGQNPFSLLPGFTGPTRCDYFGYSTSNFGNSKNSFDYHVAPYKWQDTGNQWTTDLAGFNICPPCDYFFCMTAALGGGNCSNVHNLPPMVMGNIPNDVANTGSDNNCNITSNTVHLTDGVNSDCYVPNWDS